jgi:hypothetical protein
MEEILAKPEGSPSLQWHRNLTEATVMVLSDHPTYPADGVLLFTRSYGDQDGILETASDLINERKVKYILMADTEGERLGEKIPYQANPGKSIWTNQLVKRGVPKDQIIYCPHPTPGERGFHTGQEASAMVKESAKQGIQSAVILTQPHQLLRATLAVLKAINDEKYNLCAYSISPKGQTDWLKPVRGSQGKELKPRQEHIADEINRIYAYQCKGDLPSFAVLFDYLQNRK